MFTHPVQNGPESPGGGGGVTMPYPGPLLVGSVNRITVTERIKASFLVVRGLLGLTFNSGRGVTLKY